MYTVLDNIKQILASNFGLASLAYTILYYIWIPLGKTSTIWRFWACFAVHTIILVFGCIVKTVPFLEFSGLLLLPELKFIRVWFRRRFQGGCLYPLSKSGGCEASHHPEVLAPPPLFDHQGGARHHSELFSPFFLQQQIFQHLIWCGAIIKFMVFVGNFKLSNAYWVISPN